MEKKQAHAWRRNKALGQACGDPVRRHSSFGSLAPLELVLPFPSKVGGYWSGRTQGTGVGEPKELGWGGRVTFANESRWNAGHRSVPGDLKH